MEAARLSRQAGLNDFALAAYEDVRSKCPTAVPAWLEAAEILQMEQRFDAADQLLTSALSALPGDLAVWRACADLAGARGDESTAAYIRADIARRTPRGPDNPMRSPDGAWRPGAGSGSAGGDEAAGDIDLLRALGFAFESLGGTGLSGGCEFGSVQHAWGADPLSLLRWAAVSPESLIAGLRARFEAIEHVEAADLYLNQDDPRELWWIKDRRYGILMHGFLSMREVAREQAVEPSRKRLRYLRDKLLGDLESAEKTFVFKLSTRHLTAEEIAGIDDALHAVGPAEILCVCPADPDHPEGRIDRLARGIWIGYLDFSDPYNNEARWPAWRALCEEMGRVRSESRVTGG